MGSKITLTAGEIEITAPAGLFIKNILEGLQSKSLTAAAAAAEPLVIPQIGERWPGQGGIYAGIMRNPEGRQYHLIVPTIEDGGQASGLRWSDDDKADITGARSEWDGQANTKAIIESGISCPAAMFADDLEIEGHQDFYLPSHRELALAWATIPEQFEKAWYWSSTMARPGAAFFQHFNDGNQLSYDVNDRCRVRAVRRLFI